MRKALTVRMRSVLLGLGVLIMLAAGMPHGAQSASPSDCCAECHGDKARLQSLSQRWSKVYVDSTEFSKEVHAGLACTTCHAGDATKDDPKEACIGIAYRDPAAPEVVEKTCGPCHADITSRHLKSIHSTMEGHRLALVDLLGPTEGPAALKEKCSNCHATCSECHMGEPDERGLLWPRTQSHRFEASPNSQVCWSCHGGTGETYLGERYNPVWGPSLMAQAGIECTGCHGDTDVHGTGVKTSFMIDAPKPHCSDCHSDPSRAVSTVEGRIAAPQFSPVTPAHAIHGEEAISCEACHTAWYANCWNCHQGRAGKTVDNVFLAVNPLTGKVHPAAHSPASSPDWGPIPAEVGGGWAIKSRHSWGESQTCEACHTDAKIYITPEDRRSPFIAAWTAERGNASFVDMEMVKLLVIDAAELKQGVHGALTCDSCHRSQDDGPCANCHAKGNRSDYAAVRDGLAEAERLLETGKAAGMDVASWQRQRDEVRMRFLQASNDFHGNPAAAQERMKAIAEESRVLTRAIAAGLEAQQTRQQSLATGIPLAVSLVGSLALGIVFVRPKRKSGQEL